MSETAEQPLFTTFTTTQTTTQSHFYISQALDESQKYDTMLHTLNQASKHDEITIHINCPGGYCCTGVQIANAIRQCRGTVTTIVEGIAHSMATIIFLAGHIRKIQPNSSMLFHNYSTVDYGKGAELVASVTATKKWLDGMMDDYYKGFLTKKEITQLKDDKDVWLNTKDVRKRLKKL